MAMTAREKEKLISELDNQRKLENRTREMYVIEKSRCQRFLQKQSSNEANHLNEPCKPQDQEIGISESKLQAEHEFAIDNELRKQHCERMHEQKLRQQIRENNQELRELEMKLKAAYVGKAIKAQLAEKELKQMKERLEAENEMELIRQRNRIEEEKEFKRKEEHKDKQRELLTALQEQIIDKRVLRQRLYKEYLREKNIIDEIVRRIQDEQTEELREKVRKRKHLREELDELRRSQDRWREQQRRQIEEENDRILRYLEEQEYKTNEHRRAEHEKRRIESALQERMCAELEEIERKAREHENLLINLKYHELQEKQESNDRRDLERKIRMRLKTRLELEEQRRENEMRNIQKRDDDEKFRTEQLRLLAERDRIEMLANEKKRQKQMEHYKIVRELMEQRKFERDCELLKLIEENEKEIQLEKRRNEIIEEERIKILKDHVAELIGYLPAGVLRERDRNLLGL